ncbi:hypothetical protein C2E23DRAFT_806366 [Lenzites betulinus]|nr:hypothetical protein C2E23DRAFT_806366 [Lenzites betulinus]
MQRVASRGCGLCRTSPCADEYPSAIEYTPRIILCGVGGVRTCSTTYVQHGEDCAKYQWAPSC